LSHPLAYANESLYHCRILMEGWREVLDARREPGHQVAQAFAPAAREHLLNAYGWLLLAACRVRLIPDRPPHAVADLPAFPDGLVRPAEIDTCEALEQGGWIGALQAPVVKKPPSQPDQLASDGVALTLSQFEVWLAELVELAGYISDAIDES
jgi:hypothetical protein